MEPGRHDPLQRVRPGAAPCVRERRERAPGHRPRRVAGEFAHAFPVFLPDGQRFLYLAVKRGADSSELFQGSLDSTETRRVFASEANVGVAGRYLISLNKGVLVAQPYDPDRGAVTGVPIEIADRILSDPPRRSGGPFSVGAERDCLQEREPEQPPALVRSRWTGAGFVPRRGRLPSPPAVAR